MRIAHAVGSRALFGSGQTVSYNNKNCHNIDRTLDEPNGHICRESCSQVCTENACTGHSKEPLLYGTLPAKKILNFNCHTINNKQRLRAWVRVREKGWLPHAGCSPRERTNSRACLSPVRYVYRRDMPIREICHGYSFAPVSPELLIIKRRRSARLPQNACRILGR